MPVFRAVSSFKDAVSRDLEDRDPGKLSKVRMKRGAAEEDNQNEANVRKALRTVLQSKKQNFHKTEIEERQATPVIKCAIKEIPSPSLPSPSSSNDSSSESHSVSNMERLRRRERNRLAAQKCRQKRKDRIDELQSQCDVLVQDSKGLEKDIETLRRQKKELETLLENHSCVMDVLKA